MNQPFTLQMDSDRVIRGDFHPARGESRGTLVISHGFKGFKDWGFFPFAGEALAEELDVVRFNFSHNGVGEDLESFSELEKFAHQTYSRDLEDLEFLLQAIEEGNLPVSKKPLTPPLFLLGHSRGAGISLVYAFDHPTQVAGVISWNGTTDLGSVYGDKEKEDMRKNGRAYIENARTKQQMPLDHVILDDLKEHKFRFNIFERARASIVPIVLIQGAEDFKRLQDGSARLAETREDIVWHRITGGSHTFNAVHPFEGETPQLKEAVVLTKRFIQQEIKTKNDRG